MSKILFLFPVSFTIEHKVGIAEFYLYVRFGADLLKNMVTTAWKLTDGKNWLEGLSNALDRQQA